MNNPMDRALWTETARKILGSWGTGTVVREANWLEVDLTCKNTSKGQLYSVLESLEEHARDDD